MAIQSSQKFFQNQEVEWSLSFLSSVHALLCLVLAKHFHQYNGFSRNQFEWDL